ncbi:translation initiation factor IF-2 [Desulfovibrio sp.]|uniref:translation initiation factor IF-2 n=1 Tax=Desulfovibrio sp. TaxID=885 RepID=UPI0023D3ADC4|nr:translation initiation factor IF-2 [Desulfovibrio sp.]MDE7240327.1 translation initiation factor IF-2 [Desulfovibrio sp.]
MPVGSRFAPRLFWAMGWAVLCLLGGEIDVGVWAAGPPGGGPPPAGAAVTEVAQRPFPLLVPLSYRWARGAAWFNALMAACPELPGAARRGLAASGLDDRAGLLALCARLHTLDHLTPDDSPDIAVAVRLVPASPEARASALREEDLLAVERALLLDMEATLLAVRRDWPPTLAEARKRAEALDAAAQRLEALWLAHGAAQPGPGGWICGPEALDGLERAARGAPDNAALWLLLAEARLQRDLPQAAVASAGEALKLLARHVARHPADERLAARARYVRGLAHWRLGQPALAEADLDAALHNAGVDSAPDDAERARRLRARAAVRLARRNVAGMCADFAAACALGDCEGLALARSRGQCRAAGTVDAEGATP